MKKHLVSYDLHKHKDYKKIIDKLKSMNGSQHTVKEHYSLWTVFDDRSAQEICNELSNYVDTDDSLKVFEYVDKAEYPLRPNFLDVFTRRKTEDSPYTNLLRSLVKPMQ